jgi:hypothetical protein
MSVPRKVLLGSLMLMLLIGAGTAQALPHQFSASYAAKARGITLGRAELAFERDEKGYYSYRSSIEAVGPLRMVLRMQISEFSQGRCCSGGILPQRYEYSRTGRSGRTDHIAFAPQEGHLAELHYKGDTRRQALPAQTIDPLSLHLALMHDLALGKRELRYLVAEPRRLKAYRLEVVGTERIRTAHGSFDSVRVEVVGEVHLKEGQPFDLAADTIPARTGGDNTSFWFAPALGYLPVRIRHTDEDEGALELELERVEARR